MSSSFDIAQQQLLQPGGIDDRDLVKTLDQIMTRSIDHADLYFELTQTESWVLEDGIIREGTHSIDQGVGVRAISEDKTGFAYSDEIILPALTSAAKAARAIARSGSEHSMQAWQSQEIVPLYTSANPLDSIDAAEKIAILKKIDERTRNRDPRVKQVIASISGSFTTVLVAGSDGTLSSDIRPLIRLNVSVIVEQDGRIEKGGAGGGGRLGYEYFQNDELINSYIDDAVTQATNNLDAKPAPAGYFITRSHRPWS